MALGVSSDAIVFLDDNTVVKEMLYPEFEAILDNVVGIDEFKNSNATAAYLRINSQLRITSAVFFQVGFDADGFVDKAWNIPLHHLSDTAGAGPDLGAGAIKLACRSQCSVSWHQRSLWDPNLNKGDANTLYILADIVKRNRLGLIFASIDEDLELNVSEMLEGTDKLNQRLHEEKIKKQCQQEFKKRSQTLINEQKLRVAAMKSEAQDHIEKIHKQYAHEHSNLAEALVATKQLFSEEKHRNLQLKKNLGEQTTDLREARERLQKDIEETKIFEKSQLLKLEEKFELEFKSKLESAKTELKEMLDTRDIELFYRKEEVKRLNEELAQIRLEKQQLVDGSGDRVLQKLVETGITFVAYQPGIDPLTIPLRDMNEYIESPLNYAAENCSIDKALYQQWVIHYEMPLCRHPLDEHSLCAKPISKVEKPTRFIAGESDRCAKHSRAAYTLSELIKVREPS
jgi:hypothetical protein